MLQPRAARTKVFRCNRKRRGGCSVGPLPKEILGRAAIAVNGGLEQWADGFDLEHEPDSICGAVALGADEHVCSRVRWQFQIATTIRTENHARGIAPHPGKLCIGL